MIEYMLFNLQVAAGIGYLYLTTDGAEFRHKEDWLAALVWLWLYGTIIYIAERNKRPTKADNDSVKKMLQTVHRREIV